MDATNKVYVFLPTRHVAFSNGNGDTPAFGPISLASGDGCHPIQVTLGELKRSCHLAGVDFWKAQPMALRISIQVDYRSVGGYPLVNIQKTMENHHCE